MSRDKDRRARELAEVLDENFGFIKAAMAGVQPTLYKDALTKIQAAYIAWKDAQ